MIEEEIKRIDERRHQIEHEIIDLNNSCAEEMAGVTNGVETRILSYAKEQELNEIIENYTSKIAKLLVEKEELEEEKRMWGE